MEQSTNKPTRKKFLYWGAALLSAVTFSKYFTSTKKRTVIGCGETTSVKMLSQDGRLVEIDKKLLASTGKKISNEELKKWVTNKSI
ncbi:MAG: hypothetical protein ABIR30_13775 [Chitinophagaceae bacterium]